MQNFILVLILFFCFSSCHIINPSFTNHPEKVVNTMFKAARQNKVYLLADLCAPASLTDGDSKEICNMPNLPKSEQQRFIDWFKTGQIVGKTIIKENSAKVHIIFGPNRSKKETINLIQLNGKWLLQSF